MKIIQCLMWKLEDIEKHLEQFKGQGFTHVLTSPLEPTKETLGNAWWKLYQPIEWKLGNELGGKEELTRLVHKARSINLEIMVDVIISHVSNAGGGLLELIPHKNCPYDRELFRVETNIYDWDNRFELNFYNNHLPYLNHYKPEVADLANNFIDELEACGIRYIRLDSARHIPLEQEGCRFLSKVFDHRNIHVMSEVIFDNKDITEAYTKYGSSFTNMFNFICNNLVSSPLSHDDYLTLDSKVSDEEILKRYKNILESGRSVLYYCRPFENLWKCSEIKEINKKYK